MEVPAAKDLIQEFGEMLSVPEIRVWCHPHYADRDGDDYYQVFKSFQEALDFIQGSKEAEDAPLIAFRGYELNLWSIEPLIKIKKEQKK